MLMNKCKRPLQIFIYLENQSKNRIIMKTFSSKHLILVFSFLVSFISTFYGQDIPYNLWTPTGEIKGSLLMPDTKTVVPVVLLLSGSGPTDRDGNQPNMKNNSLKMIAEGLKINGIASVRFDKRAIAESKAAFTGEINLRFETYINDTKAWIEQMAKDKRFSKIIIAGHSEGSLIGMVASVNNKKVNGFISIAGAGRPADEILKEQLQAQPMDSRILTYKMIDKLKKGDTIANVPAQYNNLFRQSVQPYMISWFKYNPQTEIAKLKIPILLVQGTMDMQVKTTDFELLAKANPSAQKMLIADMNHVLKSITTIDRTAQIQTYTNPALPLHPKLTDSMVEFVRKIK
jgi:pimeloyl-ACP methyl ester carboxylesterase